MHLCHRQRLRRQIDFAALRRGEWHRECGPFLMQARLRPNGESCPERRVGVIATRRLGNAVARNRAKRLLREAFRLGQEAMPAGSDVVLVARKPILRSTIHTISPEFDRNVARFASWIKTHKDNAHGNAKT